MLEKENNDDVAVDDVAADDVAVDDVAADDVAVDDVAAYDVAADDVAVEGSKFLNHWIFCKFFSLDETLKIGDEVLAKKEESGFYFRGIVQNIRRHNDDVIFEVSDSKDHVKEILRSDVISDEDDANYQLEVNHICSSPVSSSSVSYSSASSSSVSYSPASSSSMSYSPASSSSVSCYRLEILF